MPIPAIAALTPIIIRGAIWGAGFWGASNVLQGTADVIDSGTGLVAETGNTIQKTNRLQTVLLVGGAAFIAYKLAKSKGLIK